MNVTLSSLFIVCSHGRRSAHSDPSFRPPKWCPGGRPVTLEDLGGEKVWFCEAHKAMSASGFPAERQICPVYVVLEGAAKSECRMVERILIPLPQMVAGESL